MGIEVTGNWVGAVAGLKVTGLAVVGAFVGPT